jgi:hypothetical protein
MGISLESGGAVAGVSDDLAGSAGFSAESAGAAAVPAAEEPASLSDDEEQPAVAASTPARIKAGQGNDQVKSNRMGRLLRGTGI